MGGKIVGMPPPPVARPISTRMGTAYPAQSPCGAYPCVQCQQIFMKPPRSLPGPLVGPIDCPGKCPHCPDALYAQAPPVAAPPPHQPHGKDNPLQAMGGNDWQDRFFHDEDHGLTHPGRAGREKSASTQSPVDLGPRF